MAGSAVGKRGEAARGDRSPPKTPAVLSVTASSPVTSRDGRRFRRALWSSPRASSCGEKSPPPGDTPAASTSRSKEEEGESTQGGAGDSAAAPGGTGHCTGTQLTAARGAVRPGSLTPVSSSGEAWEHSGCAGRAQRGVRATRIVTAGLRRNAMHPVVSSMCSAHAVSMQCLCSAHAVPMRCPCSAHAVPMGYAADTP